MWRWSHAAAQRAQPFARCGASDPTRKSGGAEIASDPAQLDGDRRPFAGQKVGRNRVLSLDNEGTMGEDRWEVEGAPPSHQLRGPGERARPLPLNRASRAIWWQ